MVGCIILYDHLHPNGVFRRGPDVDIKSCITTVKVNYNFSTHINYIIFSFLVFFFSLLIYLIPSPTGFTMRRKGGSPKCPPIHKHAFDRSPSIFFFCLSFCLFFFFFLSFFLFFQF